MKGQKTSDRILSFIQSFSENQGYAPTIREICDAVGLRSTSTVHGHIERLVERGLLTKELTLPRTARMVNDSNKVTVKHQNDHIPSVIEWQGRIYTLNLGNNRESDYPIGEGVNSLVVPSLKGYESDQCHSG